MSTQGTSWLSTRRMASTTTDRLEALEIADFALAEHEDAAGLQVLVKPGERKTGFLDVRARDDAIQAVGARRATRASDRTLPDGCATARRQKRLSVDP